MNYQPATDSFTGKNIEEIEQQIKELNSQLTSAIWETGRRLHYVQKHDLTKGHFKAWLDRIGIPYLHAYRMIYIAQRLPSIELYQQLGSSALYLIATIPEAQRHGVKSLPDGSRKALHEMTCAELRQFKRSLTLGTATDGGLVSTDALVPDPTASEPPRVTTPPLAPDASAQPSDLASNPLQPKLREAEATIERLESELKSNAATYAADLENMERQYGYLKQFREGLSHVAAHSTTFIPDLEGVNRVIAFSHEIDHLLAKLAPMRYMDDFRSHRNQALVDSYLNQVDRVDAWVQSMRSTIWEARTPKARDVTPEEPGDTDSCTRRDRATGQATPHHSRQRPPIILDAEFEEIQDPLGPDHQLTQHVA